MTESLIRHRACGTLIFRVAGEMSSGRNIVASEWVPVRVDWAQPTAGDRMTCPACGIEFGPQDEDLEVVSSDGSGNLTDG